MNTFDKVSPEYKDKSLVQKNAAGRLLELLKIQKGESVIDVACGPGHITAQIAGMTSGRVAGTDVSEGMIGQARKLYPGIEFVTVAVEDMGFEAEFDAAFCNSALQWFTKPDNAMAAIYRCLKKGGRLGLACPATSNWTPFFDSLVSRVKERAGIKEIFSHWKNPWFHLAQKADYERFFAKAGFRQERLEIIYEQNDYSVDDAYGIWLSGAANGFLGKQYYDAVISDDYIAGFNSAVREEMQKGSQGGKVKVDFNRLYFIGVK